MPAAAPTAEQRVEQKLFDWIAPYPFELWTPRHVATAMRRDENHVYDLIAEGALEAFAVPNRKRQSYSITRRSYLLHMARAAQFHPEDMADALAEVASKLTPAEYQRFLQLAANKRGRV